MVSSHSSESLSAAGELESRPGAYSSTHLGTFPFSFVTTQRLIKLWVSSSQELIWARHLATVAVLMHTWQVHQAGPYLSDINGGLPDVVDVIFSPRVGVLVIQIIVLINPQV